MNESLEPGLSKDYSLTVMSLMNQKTLFSFISIKRNSITAVKAITEDDTARTVAMNFMLDKSLFHV